MIMRVVAGVVVEDLLRSIFPKEPIIDVFVHQHTMGFGAKIWRGRWGMGESALQSKRRNERKE